MPIADRVICPLAGTPGRCMMEAMEVVEALPALRRRKFANPDVHLQSWHFAVLSRELAPGRIVTRDMFGRKLAIYRGEGGTVHAVQSRCPHLGANLGVGQVVGDNIRCAFHYWQFDTSGRCVDIPCLPAIPASARIKTWPVEEKFGAVWVFNGEAPLFPLPHVDDVDDYCVYPRQAVVIRSHPNIVVCNGIDLQHYRAVHQVPFAEEPQILRLDDYRTEVRLKFAVPDHNGAYRMIRKFVGPVVPLHFTTWGPYLATSRIEVGRHVMGLVFSNRLCPEGSLNQTFVLLPRRAPVMRMLVRALFGFLDDVFAEDRMLIESVDFWPHLTSADEALRVFIDQVEAMPVGE